MPTPRSLRIAAIAIALASATGAAVGATGWDTDPYAWSEAPAGAFTSVGSGYALAPTPKGKVAEISATVTPISSDDPEYASAGVSIFDNLDHHWRLGLLKFPESKGRRLAFELKMRNGTDWGEEAEAGLERIVHTVSSDWKWGRSYRLSLKLAAGVVTGVVSETDTGREIFRCEFQGENVGVGRPALCVDGKFIAHVDEIDFSVSGEVPDIHDSFPEYRPVGPDTGVAGTATGFFHMEKIDGMDWAIDPLGRGTVLLGVDWCHPRGSWCEALGYRPYARFVKEHFASVEDWCRETAARLGDWGFTFLPCGCDERLRYRTMAYANAADRLYMTHRLCTGDPDWMITEYRRSPCTAFPNVFHPDFEKACEWWARQRCAPYRDDPWLVGYFIDNELAWWGEVNANKATGIWDAVWKKRDAHPAKKALRRYLAGRKPTPEIKLGFLRLVAERYFKVTTAAIRKADPNHMILGCRFAGAVRGVDPVVWEIAGKYCDVLSFNHYPWADLDRNVVLDGRNGERVADQYRMAHEWGGRPLIVTEWSFPALDTGRPCTTGGGQRMNTQEERVRASELFAKTLLSQPYIAGYSFFRWLDQPALGISKYFGEDCNYGLVSEDGVPYEGLTSMFRRIHGEALKWRTAPLPEERPAPAERGLSERDRYFAAARDRAARPREGRGPHPVEFAISEAGEWSLSNGTVSITGRVGGADMAERLVFSGVAAGRWGGLLQWDDSGSPCWTDVSRVTGVTAARDGESGVVSVTIRAEGVEKGTRFACTHRLTLAPGADDVLAEIISLENTGDAAFRVQQLFMRPFALEKAPGTVKSVPNRWKGGTEGFWRLADGSRFGVASSDTGILKAKLWYRDEDATQHPDVRFGEGAPFDLAAGATYTPSIPMGARIRFIPAQGI